MKKTKMTRTKKEPAKKFAKGTLGAMGTKRFIVALLPLIEGYRAEATARNVNNPGFPERLVPSILLTDDEGTRITIDFFDAKNEWGCAADGSTSFMTEKGRRTFDRIGVESSFYLSGEDTPERAAGTIRDQWRMIEAARARSKTSIPVPVIGFSVQPETKAEITKRLLAGSSYSFRPSGFGTGYTISTKRRWRGDKFAPEVAAFFGVETIWYSEDDCD
jgi:hypothetical protein